MKLYTINVTNVEIDKSGQDVLFSTDHFILPSDEESVELTECIGGC